MNKEEVELLEKNYYQVTSLYDEIAELSKKKPNDAINKFKLKFINQILQDANKLLKNEYKPFNDFEYFEEDDIPSNSDVKMMLSQYLSRIRRFCKDNIIYDKGNHYWLINGKISKQKAKLPYSFLHSA